MPIPPPKPTPEYQTQAEGVKHIPITATDSMLPATTYIPVIISV